MILCFDIISRYEITFKPDFIQSIANSQASIPPNECDRRDFFLLLISCNEMLRLCPIWVERHASLQSQSNERKRDGSLRAGQMDGVVNAKEEDSDEAADPPGSLRRRLHDPVCSPRLHHPQVLCPRWISTHPPRRDRKSTRLNSSHQ